MLGKMQIANQKLTPFATGADFCRIFKSDMNRLFLLSFLLTGDHSRAEKCFVSGLEASTKGNPVFKEWAQSWARRTIIQNAIEMIRPRPTDSITSGSTSDHSVSYTLTERAEIAQIVQLPAFERFALVMSVLEGYSDQECSLLLHCSRGEVIAARTGALEQIGRSAQLYHKLVSIDTQPKALQGASGSELRKEGIARAATSA